MNEPDLNSQQCGMVEMWERHTAAEFEDKSIDATMETMASDPFVNHVPVMTGGVGFNDVRQFYSTYFLPGHPADTEVVPIARTVGKDRIVDELIHKFTHMIEMPWILPGIEPTGRRVEVAVVVVILFEDGKIAGERATKTKIIPVRAHNFFRKIRDGIGFPLQNFILKISTNSRSWKN